MATPDRLRKAEDALTRGLVNDMSALWRQVSNAAEARKALEEILPALLRNYGTAAAAVAAEWYDEARRAAKVSEPFTALPKDLGDQGSSALSGWATSTGTDMDSIRSLVEGGAQRRVLSWSRETVMGNALADPAADGWQRTGVGSCPFCAMLIGRGAVYSESSADFASHDHCHCSAVPAFSGRPRPVRLDAQGKRLDSSQRTTRTDDKQRQADNARIRDWLKSHPNAG